MRLGVRKDSEANSNIAYLVRALAPLIYNVKIVFASVPRFAILVMYCLFSWSLVLYCAADRYIVCLERLDASFPLKLRL